MEQNGLKKSRIRSSEKEKREQGKKTTSNKEEKREKKREIVDIEMRKARENNGKERDLKRDYREDHRSIEL